MDLLSDALAIVRLSGALMFRVKVDGQWCIRAGPARDSLADSLPTGTDHILAFHIVLSGECRLRCAGDQWIVARSGDAVVLPDGNVHDIGDHESDEPVDFQAALGGQSLLELRDVHFSIGDAPHTSILCGFLGCDRRAFAPLFDALPPVFVTRLDERAQALVRYAVDETLNDQPGADSLRTRMAELMFLEALRGYVNRLPDDATGWLAGIHDPVVGKALGLMHDDPGRDWTVESVADSVACSRSLLAARFKSVMGETPISYLTQLRMQHAARRLSESHSTVDAVAEEVGYASPAAFQRAFKRSFGMPPAAWRRAAANGATRRS